MSFFSVRLGLNTLFRLDKQIAGIRAGRVLVARDLIISRRLPHIRGVVDDAV